MRIFGCFLVGLLLLLQYHVWFAAGGILSVRSLKQKIQAQQERNLKLQHKNQVLIAEVRDLKSGNHAVEARAREDLGMIKKNEVFYQVVK